MEFVEEKIEITKKPKENTKKPEENAENSKRTLTEAQLKNLERMREIKKTKQQEKQKIQNLTIVPSENSPNSTIDYNKFFLPVAGILGVSGLLYMLTTQKKNNVVEKVEKHQMGCLEDTRNYSTLQLDF